MSLMTVNKQNKFHRHIFLTGDKSISHRALLISALSKSSTLIHGLSEAADPMSTRSVLAQLGVRFNKNKDHWIVKGVGTNGFKAPSGPLDVGNSGTTIRLLSGILAGQSMSVTLTGDHSIRNRPMSRIIHPLSMMGADIEHVGGKAPLTIHGTNRLTAIDYRPEVQSAQVKSSVLLAGLLASGTTKFREKIKTRDHTERMLNLPVYQENGEWVIESSRQIELDFDEFYVPGDPSSAAFWCVAGSIIPDAKIRIENVGLNPTRTAFIDVLNQMGANIKTQIDSPEKSEPFGSIEVQSVSELKPISLSGPIIPAVIDELPVLAVAMAYARGESSVENAGELVVKESNRLHAIVENLTAMGVIIQPRPDGFQIYGGEPLKGARIKTYYDHRIAMSFAIAALQAEGDTTIEHAHVANVSYPEFWSILNS